MTWAAVATGLVVVLAILGHWTLWVHLINVTHSTRFRGPASKAVLLVLHLVNAGGPLWFLYQFGPGLLAGETWATIPAPLLGYGLVAAVLGATVFPREVWRHWTRRPPTCEIAVRRRVVDVAKELGFRPVGRSRRGYLAHLPWNQFLQVELVEREMILSRLPPEWDGLTLLHLSDLHLIGTPDRPFYDWVLQRCGQTRVDFLLITGDVIDSPHHYDWIKGLLGKLKWRYGAFAVLGNHDGMFDAPLVRRELTELGIAVVGNGWQTHDLRGRELVVIGNEVPWFRPAPDLQACPAGDFRLGLAHTPDVFPWACHQAIDLLVAGHTHGGQIRVPGFGAILVPSRYSKRYDQGLFWRPPTLMHVSRGLAGTKPLRWFCRPEVTWLTLRCPGNVPRPPS